jgi:hypothetical protein
MAAKASALLVYNNVPGVMVGSTLDNVTFPVLFLSHSVGQLLKDLSSLDPVAVHVTSSGQTTCKFALRLMRFTREYFELLSRYFSK